MKCERDHDIRRWRVIKAVFITIALLCVVPGVDVVARMTIDRDSAVYADEGIDSSAVFSSSDPFEGLDRLEDKANYTEREVPGYFEEEIGLLPESRDVHIDSTESIVGYVVDGEEQAVLEQLSCQMRETGWNEVSLGGVDGATFIKSSGRCTWALVSCTQVGSAVSVVMRCVHS